MWENLGKIIKLIEKTGDKCIIITEDKPPVVLMNLSDYEKLNFQKNDISGLSQEELLDKINREIAIWRAVNQDKENFIDSELDVNGKKEDNMVNSKANPKPMEIKINEPDQPATNQPNAENDEYLIEPVE